MAVQGWVDPAWRASPRYAWAVTGLAVWLILGLGLILRAGNQGVLEDTSISPYHAPAYAGLGVLVGWAIIAWERAVTSGRGWRRAFPRHYEGMPVGAIVLVGYVVLDLLWRSMAGVQDGVEGTVAPTRLLIPLGVVLVATGPVLDAGAAATRAWRPLTVAGVVSIAVIGATLGRLGGFDPAVTVLSARAVAPPRDVAEIWVMAADGSRQTRVLEATEPGVDYSLPAWSPDGERIAYTTWTNAAAALANVGAEEQTAAIWTMRADGSDRRVVLDGAPGRDWIPGWSPDGEWIAFSRDPGRQPSSERAAPAAPAPNIPPGGPLGAPPGIAGNEIWIAHPDGTAARQLTDGSANDLAPAWSPDGRRIAFASDRTGDYEIWVMDADGSHPIQLTHDGSTDGTPSWSPDGARIAYGSDRSGRSGIRIMASDGSDDHAVSPLDAEAWVPAWSPDGERIVFTAVRDGDADVWSMAVDGSDPRDLTNSPGRVDGQWSAAWSPDGTRIAYTSAGLPAPDAAPIVRQDLGIAGMLLFAVLFAALGLALVRVGAPFGSFTLVLTLDVALAAFVGDQWRFVPAAIALGLVADVAVRSTPPRWRPWIGASTLPIALTLTIGLTLVVTGELGWTPTLLLGAAIAGGLVGLTLASLVDWLAEPPAAVAVQERSDPSP